MNRALPDRPRWDDHDDLVLAPLAGDAEAVERGAADEHGAGAEGEGLDGVDAAGDAGSGIAVRKADTALQAATERQWEMDPLLNHGGPVAVPVALRSSMTSASPSLRRRN